MLLIENFKNYILFYFYSRHKYKEHPKSLPVRCEFCHRLYDNQNFLDLHKVKCHKEPTCDVEKVSGEVVIESTESGKNSFFT